MTGRALFVCVFIPGKRQSWESDPLVERSYADGFLWWMLLKGGEEVGRSYS